MKDADSMPKAEHHGPIGSDLGPVESAGSETAWQAGGASHVATQLDRTAKLRSLDAEEGNSVSEASFEAELAEDLAEYVARAARFEAFRRAYQDVGLAKSADAESIEVAGPSFSDVV